MRLARWIVVAGVMGLLVAAAAPNPTYDQYGGWTSIRGRRTGFFHTEHIDRRWWLVSPEGNAFFSKGVCAVRFEGDFVLALGYSPYERAVEQIHKDPSHWAVATVQRLRAWGLNTAGAWSSEVIYKQEFPYTPVLHLAEAARPKGRGHGDVPDVYDPAFAEAVERVVEKQCAPFAKDPWLLGYFTDNELSWQRGLSVLERYLMGERESPGRRRAEAFMAERGQGDALPTEEDRDAFLELVAGEYFRITTAAIRRHDPNHLILGCRFAGAAPDPVLRAMRGRVDVVSLNDYDAWPPVKRLAEISEIVGTPTLISEFSFKAMDSKLPNTRGAGRPVATQLQRADDFERYALILSRLPSCVGYHWFQYTDQPREGRFDGENSNFGLVGIEDKPWDLLVLRLRRVNLQLERERSGWYPPTSLPSPVAPAK